jgi:hypothetical protein
MRAVLRFRCEGNVVPNIYNGLLAWLQSGKKGSGKVAVSAVTHPSQLVREVAPGLFEQHSPDDESEGALIELQQHTQQSLEKHSTGKGEGTFDRLKLNTA